MGEIEALFIATDVQLEEAYGKTAYFGEIFGKHSEVFAKLTDDKFNIVSDDKHVVESLRTALGEDCCGPNPLNFIE